MPCSGVSASDVTGGGARIEEVTASSGAAKAGLKAGDVITKVDDTTVSDATELTAAIRAHAGRRHRPPDLHARRLVAHRHREAG